MSAEEAKKYGRISFETFKEMAKDSNLSVYEKIGFPDDYRKNLEKNIFEDLVYKLELERENITILDIGCGCSDLLKHLIDNAALRKQKIIINDSQEMLDLTEDQDCIEKCAGAFPDCSDKLRQYENSIDEIIVYSVLQHIVLEQNPYSFFDKALTFLKPGGRLILGDIPNYSMRNRFLESDTGLKFHQEYTKSDDSNPPLMKFPDNFEKIDDGLLFGILLRYRALGFNAYIVPQRRDLPMANRREDIIIHKV